MNHLQLAKILICLLGVIITSILGGRVFARGTLGESYIGFEVGGTRPGDSNLRGLDSFVTQGGLIANVPVNTSVDITFSLIGWETIQNGTKEVGAASGAGGCIYHFSPDESSNPFVGIQFGMIDTSVDDGVQEVTHDQFGFGLIAGVEYDLSAQAALSPGIKYERYEGSDEFYVGADINYWFEKETFVGGAVGYGCDAGDILVGVSIGFGF